jgi:hypothetical protein
MLAHLHGGRADGTYERRLLTYTRPDLLVLDDFGLKPLAPPADVINERYERGAVIITSNRAFSEWPDLFQRPLLASAVLDRLAHHAQQMTITGDSFRAKGRRRAPENEKGGHSQLTGRGPIGSTTLPSSLFDQTNPSGHATISGPRSAANGWLPTPES